MASLLTYTLNTRWLREGCTRYLRSDVPDRLSEEEIGWLLEHNIRTVIDLRYFHCLTQDRVAKVLSVSQVQVSRIEKKAIAALRELLKEC